MSKLFQHIRRAVGIGVILLGSLLCWRAEAGTLGAPSITPGSITSGIPSAVTFSVRITDPGYLAGSANVQRLNAAGAIVSVLGLLHDDGQQGDALAGDKIYTLRATLQEAGEGPIRFQVSAGFTREIVRTKAGPLELVVTRTPAPVIGPVQFAPATGPAGVGVLATLTALIDNGATPPASVTLQKLDASGAPLATIGQLRDDGNAGDSAANDSTYTLRTTVLENVAGTIDYRVAVRFSEGGPLVYSGPLSFAITGGAAGVGITAPADGAYLNTPVLTVQGVTGDGAALVKINGIAAPLSDKRFAAAVPLNEGPNTVTAVATNSNGSTSTASVLVTLDTTAPKVEIYSPAEGASTSAAVVTVSGVVNDIVVGTVNPQQATVTVNGVAAEVLNRSFLARDVPLALGANQIQAVATDRAGNRATTTVKLERLAPGRASLSIVSGNNQSALVGAAVAAPLVVKLLDGQGAPQVDKPVVFRVIGLDGTLGATQATGYGLSAMAVNTDAQGQARAYFRLGSRAGSGNNLVEASAAGVASTADFVASGTPTAAQLVVVDSGNNQVGVVGQALPLPLIAVVTDASNNRLGGVPLIFTSVSGGGGFGPSRNRTLQAISDSDGRVAATLVMGPEPGINNNVVEVSFSGNRWHAAAFAATGKVPGPASQTRISGVVLDNSNKPIPGVTMRLLHISQGNASNIPQEMAAPVRTDEQGQFLMQPVPVGIFKLMADGGTALRPGSWPTLDFDMITIAGHDNTIGMPVYLPELNHGNRACVDETTGGTVTIPEAPGFALTIAAGAATFPGGSRSGCVSVTPVNIDKVPMVPGFGQQPRFIVTIQPVGTHFNPPARMTIPNVDGLAPRAVTEMYSYDHDLASFVAIGSATVSQDGSTISSDIGSGVIKAGWHSGGNPASTGAAGTCPTCQKCEGSSCIADDGQTPPQASPTDCKEEVCRAGSLVSQNKDSEKTGQDCRACKNGVRTPVNEPAPNPNDEVSCCFEGKRIPNVAPSVALFEQQCSPALRSQNRSLFHEIDGCSSSPQDPMALANPFTQLNHRGTSTAFGAVESNPPKSGSGAPGRNLPCNWHDVAYQTCGKTKRSADDEFLVRASAVCNVAYRAPNPYTSGSAEFVEFNEEYRTCMAAAQSYVNVLRELGIFTHNKRQQQYCTCCRPIGVP
ncbi:choice-of-anchor X domain-containing protein [Massilia sp. CCM 8734]|uniref:choice-of-anchor X domain-containing protein n=1 Tax=Massilia sp. CCM 8734 TaxID=2609283 RepID=UPI0014210C1E|nr:choice-of-anchor X domain-containing protein [Massilia sp. CCM 8734]NHZ97548.1 hypothetical protein [Massilia sp. CCM 8734]